MAVSADNFTLSDLGQKVLNRTRPYIRRTEFLIPQMIELHHVKRVLHAAIDARLILGFFKDLSVPPRGNSAAISIVIKVGPVMITLILKLCFPVLVGH